MDVMAFCVGFAIGPRNDVGCAEQGHVANVAEWTALLPLIQQSCAEIVLPDTLDHEALSSGFGKASRAMSNLRSGASGRLIASLSIRSSGA